MSGGGGGGGQNTTVTNNTIPQWMSDKIADNYVDADNLASRPYNGYDGQRVSGMAGDSLAAAQRIRGMQGIGDASLAPAAALTQQAVASGPQQVSTNFVPDQIAAGQFGGSADLAKWMNPYLDDVEAAGLRNIETQRQTAINDVGDRAVAAGAFGGSRHGVREAVTNAEAARAAGDFSGQVRSAGYQQAVAGWQADRDAALQAAAQNQQAGLSAAQLNSAAEATNQQAGLAYKQLQMGAGAQLGQLSSEAARQRSNEIAMLDAAGQQQRVYDQQVLDDQYQRWYDAQRYPFEMLNIKSSVLASQPYSTSQTSTSTSNGGGGGSTLGNALGGAAMGAGVGSMIGSGYGGWGALVGGTMGALSDERDKENRKKLGVDPVSGVVIEAFDYKGDTKSTGKRIGVMAQDVERKVPGAVFEIGGHKVIDTEVFDIEAAVRRARPLRKAA